MTKFELHEQNPVNLHAADFKQPFPNNCTISMLHIIPNRKLHTISFQMASNVAVCTVGALNSTKIGLVALLYLDNQTSDHPGSYMFLGHFLTLSKAMVSVFKLRYLTYDQI